MRTSSKVGYETIIRAIQQDEQALLEILLPIPAGDTDAIDAGNCG